GGFAFAFAFTGGGGGGGFAFAFAFAFTGGRSGFAFAFAFAFTGRRLGVLLAAATGHDERGEDDHTHAEILQKLHRFSSHCGPFRRPLCFRCVTRRIRLRIMAGSTPAVQECGTTAAATRNDRDRRSRRRGHR